MPIQPRELQALIEEDPDASVVDISEQRPPGTEYLHAIAYWLAVRDHFFIVQHVSLKANAMEEYFTWLLRDKSETISAEHYVQLQAVFDRDLVGGDLGEIKSIEVGGLVPETVREIPDEAIPAAAPRGVIEYEAHEQLGARAIRTFDRARNILDAAIGPMETQRIIESIPDEAAL